MKAIYTLLITGELIIGIWGNGFIVLENCSGWLKKRAVSLTDVILVSLATSRTCLLCVIYMDGFIMVLFPDTYGHGEMMNILDIFWTTCNHSTVWFTLWLHIFYLLKIASISYPVFLWLKLKMNRVLGILLMSFFISSIISVSLNNDLFYDFRINNEENITWEFKVSKIPTVFKIILNLGTVGPFILCLLSFVLLFFSLLRHTKQMTLHATGSRDPSIEAHMRAIKTIVIFLALFIMYYALFFIVTSSFLIPHGKLEVIFGGLRAVIIPLSHSFILLMGNSKLKEAFLRVLGIVKGFHKIRKYFVSQRILI
ncbi:LOW QUALITY PROTEIN: taste receptor type 2 member 9 [Dama dama]